MNNITIAMVAIGVATNILCFLFGMMAGRNSACKAVRTFETADTAHDISAAPDPSSPKGHVN